VCADVLLIPCPPGLTKSRFKFWAGRPNICFNLRQNFKIYIYIYFICTGVSKIYKHAGYITCIQQQIWKPKMWINFQCVGHTKVKNNIWAFKKRTFSFYFMRRILKFHKKLIILGLILCKSRSPRSFPGLNHLEKSHSLKKLTTFVFVD